MSANSLNLDFHDMLANHMATVLDPGASGTIRSGGKGLTICEVTTAAAEGRTLESASSFPAYALMLVVLKTDGGDLTITGAASGTEVLANAGDSALFQVTNANGTKEWRYIGNGQLDALEDRMAALEGLALGSKTVDIPIGNNWRKWDDLVTNLAAADANDELGLVTGTFVTDAPSLNVTVATPSNAPFYARDPGFVVPWNYDAGTNLTLDVTVVETVAATTATVDVVVVRRAAPTVDICATAAQSVVGAAAGIKSFTLTGTNVVPGEVLDIRLNLTLDDGAATPNYSITKVNVDYTAAG